MADRINNYKSLIAEVRIFKVFEERDVQDKDDRLIISSSPTVRSR